MTDPVRWKDPDGGAPDGVAELLSAGEKPPPMPAEVAETSRSFVAGLAAGSSRGPGPIAGRLVAPLAAAALLLVVAGGLLLVPRYSVRRPESQVAQMGPGPRVSPGEGVPLPGSTIPDAGAAEEAVVAQPTEAPEDSARRAATKTASGEGFITAATIPWTTVFVDGARVGQTPLLKVPVAPGRRELLFVSEDGRERRVAVTVRPGRTERLQLWLDSDELRDGGATPPRYSPSLSLSPPYEPGFIDDGSEEVATGYLSLSSSPRSHVEVDGHPVGVTPIARLEVPVGGRLLTFRTDDGTVRVISVTVRAGETVRRSVLLDESPPAAAPSPPPGHGFLSINTVPRSGIFLDGRDTGRHTPVVRFQVPAGNHRLELRSEAGASHVMRIRVPEGEHISVTRRLDE